MSENNQLEIINKSIIEIKKMPEVLIKNQGRASKGKLIGNKLLGEWELAERVPEIDLKLELLRRVDEKSNKYLVNVGAATKEMKGEREPYTQLMTTLAKYFTTCENDLDKAKEDSIPFKIQQNRNKLATLEADLQKERERLAAEKLAKEQAKIDLRSAISTFIATTLNKFQADKKLKMSNAFNSITLETYKERAELLKKLSTEFPKVKQGEILEIKLVVPDGLTQEDYEEEMINAHNDFDYDQFYISYKEDIDSHKKYLIDRLPSKKEELDEAKRLADEAAAALKLQEEENDRKEKERQKQIAEAAGKKKKELEAAAEQAKKDAELKLAENKRLAELQEEERKQKIQEREDNEKLELEKQAEIANEKSQEKIDLKNTEAKTMSMFDQMAETAQVDSAAQVKAGVFIELHHPAAWMLIAQLWWENVGKTLGNDDIAKKTFAQMKAVCEDLALKKDIKIESNLLVYKIQYKAVNKKQ